MEGGLGMSALPWGQGAFVHQDVISAEVFAKLKVHRPLSRGTRSCNSPTSVASDQWVEGWRGLRGRRFSSGPLGQFAPPRPPALGGPMSGPQGRQSGRRAPIGREVSGGGEGRCLGLVFPVGSAGLSSKTTGSPQPALAEQQFNERPEIVREPVQ